MKQLILELILIFSITVSVAQPQIVFDNKNHDFGTFEEETGPVTHDFRFERTLSFAKRAFHMWLHRSQIHPGTHCPRRLREH